MKTLHGLWLSAALAACSGDPLPAAPVDAGGALDSAALEPPNCATPACPAVDLRDRACQDATRCAPAEGCGAAGRCGVCARDAECRRGERCAAGACLPDALPAWSLDVDPLDLQRIINLPKEEIFVPCRLTVDGTAYAQGCQVRLRGGSSRAFPKKSFRITFDRGAPHPGINRKINLRAEFNDRTSLRNFLAVQTLRRLTAVPAPSARFVRLTLNGAYYGLMSEVDVVDEHFLEAQGLASDAPTYEADPPVTLSEQGAGALVPLPDRALYAQVYDKKAGPSSDYGDLIALIEQTIWPDYLASRAGGPAAARVSARVDVGEYLDYLAAMALIQNHDHIRKNYYLTLQPRPQGAPRWLAIAWDMDLTFGCLWNEGAMNTLCDTQTFDADPTRGRLPDAIEGGYPAQFFYNQLTHQVLADATLRRAFDARVCAYAQSPFWTTEIHALIDATAAHVRGAVSDDPNDRNADLAGFDAEVARLHEFVRQRAVFLRGALACAN